MPSFRLKLTAPKADPANVGGLRFWFFFFVVLFAAVNTGNNLTYLVLAALCGAAVVSWASAALSLHGLRVRMRLPEEIFAGEEARFDFTVRKTAGPMPASSVSLGLHGEIPVEHSHEPYVDHLRPGGERKSQGLFVFSQRGRYRLAGVHAHCNYPFGLVRLGKLMRQREEVLILPRLVPFDETFRHSTAGRFLHDSLHRGLGGGLLNIRPFLPGDDHRSMHWKASAKLDELMIKEFSREEGEAIWLHFNPLRSARQRAGDAELFEAGVSLAASVAYHGRKLGHRMLFSAPGLRLVPANRNGSGEHIRVFLHYLAEIKTGGRMLGAPDLTATSARRRSEETMVVIDPLNEGVQWGAGAVVLDRSSVKAMLEGGR